MSVDTESIGDLQYKVWLCDKCNDNRQRFYTITDYHEHLRVKHGTEFVPQLPSNVNGAKLNMALEYECTSRAHLDFNAIYPCSQCIAVNDTVRKKK